MITTAIPKLSRGAADWLNRQPELMKVYCVAWLQLHPDDAIMLQFIEDCAKEKIRLHPRYMGMYVEAWQTVKGSSVLKRIVLNRMGNPAVREILETCKQLQAVFKDYEAVLVAEDVEVLWSDFDEDFRVRDELATIQSWLRDAISMSRDYLSRGERLRTSRSSAR